MQPEASTAPLLATTSAPTAIAYANVVSEDAMNKLNMNIQGDSVHLSGVFDFEGLEKLEKKIAGLKALMEPDQDELLQ